MAKRITELVELAVAPALDDLFTIVDVSEVSVLDQNKKIKYETLLAAIITEVEDEIGEPWLLDGNTVASEKWIGTASNHRFPIRTNNTEKLSIEINGSINRVQAGSSGLYSIPDSPESNVSWGRNALSDVVLSTGANNIGIGTQALENLTTADSCIAIGSSALVANNGDSNIAIGVNAGQLNTDGTNNIFIGAGAGAVNTSGYCLTLVGTGANVATNSLNTAIALGQSATITANNQIVKGSASFFYNQEQLFWSATAIHGTFYRTSTPEGVQAAQVGSICYVNDGAGNGSVFLKATEPTPETGWEELGTGGGGGCDCDAASETVAGIAEIATQAETDTGTDDARIVTPLKLATWWNDFVLQDEVVFGGNVVVDGGNLIVGIGQQLFVDVINEQTAAAGVTIDGLLIKDNTVNKVAITAPATAATLTIDDGFTLHTTGNVTALSGSHTGASSGTNTGDQTTIAGITGTKAQFNTAASDGDFLFVGDIVIGTNVQAWDADLDTWAGVTPAAGIATFLATPTSANLAAAITDEISGGTKLVFQTVTALQTIASTIAWTGGTPPATPLAEEYIWVQTGKRVTVDIRMEYTTAGATNTDLTIDFMADLPTPAAFTSWDNSESGIAMSNGIVATTRTNDPVATRGSIKKSAGGVYQFKLTFASNASILVIIHVEYTAA